MGKMRYFGVFTCNFSVLATLIYATIATDYKVGQPNGGWNMNTDLKAWSSSIQFYPGDSLTFSYLPYHDIVEVSKENFDRCSTQNNFAFYTGGFTIIMLTAPGTRYFICGVPGHCIAGMKLQINVNSLGSSLPPPPPVSLPSPPQSVSPHFPPPPLPVQPPALSPPPSPTSNHICAPAPKQNTTPSSKTPLFSPRYAPAISPTPSPTKAPSPSPTLSSEASVDSRISLGSLAAVGTVVLLANLVH